MGRWIIILVVFISTACATYHVGSGRREMPGGYDRVAVPMFTNGTYETGIETYYTTAIIEEIERNHLAKVTTKEEAQVILEGSITNISYERGGDITNSDAFPNLPTGAVLSKDFRIRVETEVRLVRRSDGKVLWSSTFAGERRYPAPQITISKLNSSDALYNQSARMQNIQVLAKDMMVKVHDNMTENF